MSTPATISSHSLLVFPLITPLCTLISQKGPPWGYVQESMLSAHPAWPVTVLDTSDLFLLLKTLVPLISRMPLPLLFYSETYPLGLLYWFFSYSSPQNQSTQCLASRTFFFCLHLLHRDLILPQGSKWDLQGVNYQVLNSSLDLSPEC